MKRRCTFSERKNAEVENVHKFIMNTSSDDFSEIERMVSPNFDYSAKFRGYLINTAIIKGKPNIVRGFIRKGVNIPDDNAPLFNAVAVMDLELARVLLEEGQKVNVVTRSGSSPLDMAALRGDTSMARLLMRYGADINRHASPESSLMAMYTSEEMKAVLKDGEMERRFSTVVVAGILFRGPFNAFLGKGVYDPRILIVIASFAYN